VQDLLARKNAAVMAEREHQKDLRNRRAADEAEAARRSAQKRAEIEEKIRKRAEERNRQWRHLQDEDRERKKKFDNLEAPFKQAMRPMLRDQHPSSPPKEAGPSALPREAPKLQAKPVAKRPGKVKERDEEVRNLHAAIAQKRAEMRALARKQQDDAKAAPPPPPPPPLHDLNALIDMSSGSSDDDDRTDWAVLDEMANGTLGHNTPLHRDVEPERPPQKIYDLGALMELSSDSSDDAQSNDYMMLVAIAQNILEHKPSSDESDNDEGELVEDQEELPPPEAPTEASADENHDASPEASPDENRDASPEASPNENTNASSEYLRSPSVFMFGGRALDLMGVRNDDSLGYRIEALRQFLEQEIGLGKFIEAYQFLSEGCDELQADQVDGKMRGIFPTPNLQAYYPLIQQLVVCEDSLGAE
jgi:NIMA (never in mitosis gene a)-related kinase